MKRILTFLLLLPLASFAQRIQSDHTDDFGQARRIATSRVEFGGMSSSISGTVNICESDTLLRMNIIFRAGKATVIDERTTLVLRLLNGETVQVNHIGNRKELTATEPGFFVFAVTEGLKAKLMVAAVAEYSIQTTAAAVRVSLNEEQQTAFHDTLFLLQEHARSMAALD